jgi:hypothetical protein
MNQRTEFISLQGSSQRYPFENVRTNDKITNRKHLSKCQRPHLVELMGSAKQLCLEYKTFARSRFLPVN